MKVERFAALISRAAAQRGRYEVARENSLDAQKRLRLTIDTLTEGVVEIEAVLAETDLSDEERIALKLSLELHQQFAGEFDRN